MLTTVSKIIAAKMLSRIDLKALLKYILGFSDAQLISEQNYVLTADEISRLNQCITLRKQGVPIHYILGYKEFYSRKFKVNQHTLIPRPETELLVEQVLNIAKSNDRVLDLGTGCGCIAITCKLENSTLNVSAIEQDINTLQVAQENANDLHADIQIFQSNWYSNINNKFNIIVSNPPYIAYGDSHLNDLKYEPTKALTDGNDGLDDLKMIIAGAYNHLLPCGYLLVEHGYNQGEPVRQLFGVNGFAEVHTIQDYAMLDRVTLGRVL